MKLPKLIGTWREWKRWWSMQLMALAAAWQAAVLTLPPEYMAMIPEAWKPWISLSLLLAAMLARPIKQDL